MNQEEYESFMTELKEHVELTIDPYLENHGGWLEIDDYDGDTGALKLRMMGGCQGCGASSMTLAMGITESLKDMFPSRIKEVVDITDHSAGENPFFLGNPFEDLPE
jgi:Fe/S biogenesis protein NfuA